MGLPCFRAAGGWCGRRPLCLHHVGQRATLTHCRSSVIIVLRCATLLSLVYRCVSRDAAQALWQESAGGESHRPIPQRVLHSDKPQPCERRFEPNAARTVESSHRWPSALVRNNFSLYVRSVHQAERRVLEETAKRDTTISPFLHTRAV